ncbi:MAG: adenylate/guanylate cyclase domain-containing protein [Planctomycetes bacterium]|nr:adenylate/guanylate cyclase domain-containing protein [Planctomycetota bacterium]
MSDLFKQIESASDEEIEREFGVRKAVMVVDSSGFTRICKAKGILHFLRLVVRMRRLVRAAVDEGGGSQFRCEADNCYAVFATAAEALAAAAAIQVRTLADPEEHLSVSIGLGYGDLLDAGHEGMFGDEMNFASKLGEDTASANEVRITEGFHQALSAEERAGFEPESVRVSGVDLHHYCRTWRDPAAAKG